VNTPPSQASTHELRTHYAGSLWEGADGKRYVVRDFAMHGLEVWVVYDWHEWRERTMDSPPPIRLCLPWAGFVSRHGPIKTEEAK
jgi:hypothetical protein